MLRKRLRGITQIRFSGCRPARRLRERTAHVHKARIYSGRQRGVVRGKVCGQYENCCNDDDLVLYLLKKLR